MKENIALIFTGDISFDRYMDGQWDDENLLSEEICDFLRSADHVIANIEGPIIKNQKNGIQYGVEQLLHTMDPNVTKVLKKIHADIWNICNNHIMDAGEKGLESTLQEAEKMGPDRYNRCWKGYSKCKGTSYFWGGWWNWYVQCRLSARL